MMGTATTTGQRPSYLDGLPLAAEAFQFVSERHAGQVREADAAPFLLHPLEVGALLFVFGFGPEIARLVEAVSENPAVDDPVERNACLRRQVAAAGDEAAAVFAADKLSKVREIRIRAACDAGFTRDDALRRKLDHYIASRRMLEEQLGDHPVVQALAFELEALHALPPQGRVFTSL